QPADHVEAFRVHLHETAVFLRLFQEPDHRVVIYPEIVKKEDLEARRAIFMNGLLHFFYYLGTRIRDTRVNAVVHDRLSIRLAFLAVHRVAEHLSLVLEAEIDDGGGAPAGGGSGAAFPVVGGRGAHEGHLDM